MELDSKQKVLVAIYTEYQKEDFDMRTNIKADVIGIEYQIFAKAIVKLINEEYITGVKLVRGGIGNKIHSILLDDMLITKEGIEYVESKIGLEKTLSGKEKAKHIGKKALEAGWDKGSDLAAKVIGELIKQS
ncbi:YjcQ protein [Clostridium cavendishii DSM 21758]|uniref:YjcQ protein n=1 Tax=Clostridium cavendishii DSM 21758 TaxID=1121302 RepID=A0A1M6K127_9CLOT|nr:YjcQ family protein [Clostridium cavendishii]SHJ52600.1 YjcQ protein [Clostridium cavendishii DSM 21758]